MTKLPSLKTRKIIKILSHLGFQKIRQEGSYIFFKHKDGRVTVVPFHQGKDIGKGLLRAIINDIKISPKEFQKLL